MTWFDVCFIKKHTFAIEKSVNTTKNQLILHTMKKLKYIYLYAIAATLGLITFGILAFSGKKANIAASLTGLDGSSRDVHSFDLNGKSFTWAGEVYPMEKQDVFERMDREILINAYLQSTTIMNIKLTAKYFPTIERILAEEGVPDDLKYLCVAESTLRNVTSPAGAKGLWQFMKPTGVQYGLEINDEIDERYHTEKSTRAACRYLKDNYKQFGSWFLAAAAYNEGAPRLSRELREQRGKSFFDLNLNEETARYVFRLGAIKEIMEHPATYDFFIPSNHMYAPFAECNEITINGATDFASIAEQYGISFRALKVQNPWLLKPTLTNATKKTYTLRIPKTEN
jgi:membrane-bound lytic murein transglycosylase D